MSKPLKGREIEILELSRTMSEREIAERFGVSGPAIHKAIVRARALAGEVEEVRKKELAQTSANIQIDTLNELYNAVSKIKTIAENAERQDIELKAWSEVARICGAILTSKERFERNIAHEKGVKVIFEDVTADDERKHFADRVIDVLYAVLPKEMADSVIAELDKKVKLDTEPPLGEPRNGDP